MNMRLKQKIGIIGKGFVGSAVQFGFSPSVGCDTEVRVYDVDPNKSTHTLEETVNESNFVFFNFYIYVVLPKLFYNNNHQVLEPYKLLFLLFY